MARRRTVQIGLWLLIGTLISILQTSPSFLLSPHNFLASRGFKVYCLSSIAFGTLCQTSAFLLCDFIFLRRPLEAAPLRKYVGIIALVALLSGLVFQGLFIMLGHTITAAAICFIAYTFRKKSSSSESEATHSVQQRSGM